MSDTKPVHVVGKLKDVDPTTEQVFRYASTNFVRDNHAMTWFEKAFGVSLHACYSKQRVHPDKHKLRWDCNHLVLFFQDGRIVEMHNSEWASFDIHN